MDGDNLERGQFRKGTLTVFLDILLDPSKKSTLDYH